MLKNKVIAVLQPNYIPWKGYFDMIHAVDEFILLDDVQYTAQDWRNRNLIKTRHGVKWLSIPVRVRKMKDRINEVQVANCAWKQKHWNAIVHSYTKAPYFEFYYYWLRTLFLEHDEKYLSNINYRFITAINSVLGITTPITWSSSYETRGTKMQKVLELCKKANADVYLSGPSAKAYLDEEPFRKEGISIDWMNYSGYPEYAQLFPPFEHNVSILDLILNQGPDALNYLKKLKSMKTMREI